MGSGVEDSPAVIGQDSPDARRPALASASPALPRWGILLPYLIGSLVTLLLVYAEMGPHPSAVRVGCLALAAVLLALGIGHHASASRALDGAALSNSALALANEQLTSMNEHLHLLATTDPLTRLPNRAILKDSLAQALRPGDESARLALLLLDLDRFKEVNDALGHQSGDVLLQQIGARLLDALGGSGLIARLGGDEFAVVLLGADAARAVETARRCLQALDAPFPIEGHAVRSGASVGIALAPDHGSDAGTLLRCADVAMYAAKGGHGGFAVYAPAQDRHSPRRLGMAGDLQRAIAGGGLVLHYQPKVRFSTGEICGVEALARWPHQEHGLVPPDQFIPLAEQTGLIVPLTRWALEAALTQCRSWQAMGSVLPVAVNISMRDLQDPDLPDAVTSALRHTGVAPSMLTLEITESMLMADPICAMDVLARLDRLGVRISIDDFGTGHSSLTYLKQLPVDELKIDQAFVINLAAQRTTGVLKDRMIVRSVTALAHALGLEVVAEGVESRPTFELLASMRCNVAQGHYLSRALPAADVEQWVRNAAIEPAPVGAGDQRGDLRTPRIGRVTSA
jgi:diguanylate cyclase (GGDEF)-like protein